MKQKKFNLNSNLSNLILAFVVAVSTLGLQGFALIHLSPALAQESEPEPVASPALPPESEPSPY